MNIERLRGTTGVFALTSVNLALAVSIAWPLLGHEDGVDEVTSSAIVPKVEPLPASVFGGDPGVQVSKIVDQPVFHADRTFVKPQTTLLEPVTPPMPPYTLAGYMALPGKPPVAIVRDTVTGRTQRMVMGQAVGGWTLRHADAGTALLESSGFEITVTRSGTSPAIQQPQLNQPAPALAGFPSASADTIKQTPRPASRSLRKLANTSNE